MFINPILDREEGIGEGGDVFSQTLSVDITNDEWK